MANLVAQGAAYHRAEQCARHVILSVALVQATAVVAVIAIVIGIGLLVPAFFALVGSIGAAVWAAGLFHPQH